MRKRRGNLLLKMGLLGTLLFPSVNAGILDEIGGMFETNTQTSEQQENQNKEESSQERIYESFADSRRIGGRVIVDENIPIYLRRNGIGDVEEIANSKILVFYRPKKEEGVYEISIRLFADEDWNVRKKSGNFNCFDNDLTLWDVICDGKISEGATRGFYRNFWQELKINAFLGSSQDPSQEELEDLRNDLIREQERKLTIKDLLTEVYRAKRILASRATQNPRELAEHYRIELREGIREIDFELSKLTENYTGIEIKTYIVSKEPLTEVILVGMYGIRNSRPGANLVGNSGTLEYRIILSP